MKQLSYLLTSITLLTLAGSAQAVKKGAGVLPYSKDSSGTTYLYIARETGGQDAGKWSDFGGIFESFDASFCDVAAREFAEEALEIFNGYAGDAHSKQLNQSTTLNCLEDVALWEQKHLSCVDKKFGNFTYRQYYLRVQNNYKAIFSHFKEAHLKNISLLAQSVTAQLHARTEKDVVASIKKEQLIQAVKNNTPFVKIVASSYPERFPAGTVVPLRRSFFETLKVAYQQGILQAL